MAPAMPLLAVARRQGARDSGPALEEHGTGVGLKTFLKACYNPQSPYNPGISL